MKITAALKAFLVSKSWATADATDEVLRQAVGVKLASGELPATQFAELTKDNVASGQQALDAAVLKATAPLTQAMETMTKTVCAIAEKVGLQQAPPANGDKGAGTPPPAAPPVPGTDEFNKAVNALLEKRLGLAGGNGGAGVSMSGILSRSAHLLGTPEVRVKAAVESYSHSRTAAICPVKTAKGSAHPDAGRQAMFAGQPLEMPSERDKAIVGATFKWNLSKHHSQQEIAALGDGMGRHLLMTDHDWDLVHWAMHNCSWSGYVHPDDEGTRVHRRKLSEFERKALLDDSTSGGIEIVPIEFDDMLVTTPVLYGELFPLVNVVNITRGRRVKGGAVTNPTLTWGTAEGTAITPFNTSAFVGAFDTPVYPVTGAMEVGLDFEEDSPTNIGQIVLTKYGEKFQEQLDLVIAIGDGVSQPQGIFTSTAPIVINTDNGVGGSPTVGDYEGLLFGVAKAFRNTKGSRNAFFANETTYRRARAIPVGPGDERRVFGITHSDYQLLDHPYKIQINIPNNKIGFANFGYYRMYRRLGMTVRIETAGQYLATKNLKLLVVRARFGGQLELGGAAATALDAQN